MSCKWCRKKCDACRLNPHGREAAQAVMASTSPLLRWLVWEDKVLWAAPMLIVLGAILHYMLGLPPLWIYLFAYVSAALALLYLIGWYVIYRRRWNAAEKAHLDHIYRDVEE